MSKISGLPPLPDNAVADDKIVPAETKGMTRRTALGALTAPAILQAGTARGVVPAASGPIYQSIPEGEAATPVGEIFFLTVNGSLSAYRRIEGGSVEIFSQATTAALASPYGAQMICLNDGGKAQDAIAVAGNPIELVASSKSLPIGSTVRTANGFTYKVAAPDAPNAHIVTAGGVKLYIADPVITPDALGAPLDGASDDAPYFERAFQISKTVSLVSTSTYRLASIIGLPDQTLYSDVSIFLHCNGAKIVANSPLVGGVPEAIFTSAAAKADPDSTRDLYTGKLFVSGGNWTEDAPSVLFNGDRIYDLRLIGNSFASLDTVVKSYRSKGASYPNGYIQSLSMTGNQFSGIRRWVDARKAFDLSFEGNGGTNCEGGVYVDSTTEDVAVSSIRYIDTRFQGGGCALVLGKVVGGVFIGYYGEANTSGDAATAKCDLWFKNGPSPSSGVTLIGFKFQPTAGQRADTTYCSIRWDSTANQPGSASAPPVLIGCWSTGTRIITPNRAVDFIGIGGTSADIIKNARAPMSPQSARRTTFGASRTYPAATELTAGVYNIAKISVADIKALVSNQAQRAAQGEIRVLMQHRTAGRVVVGTSLAVIGFVAMGASEGIATANTVDDVYCGFFLAGFAMVPGGSIIDSLGEGAVTRQHFTAPALTATRSGDDYVLALSGYAAVSNPNYGSANQISSHITISADARSSSNAFSSAIGVTA